MKLFKFVVFTILITSCQVEKQRTLVNILESSFEVKQISGYNRPNINIKQDSLYVLLVALHYGFTVEEVSSQLNWSKEKTTKKVDLLIENKLLKKDKSSYIPTLAIFTLDRGNDLKEKAKPIAIEIADSIVAKMAEIKNFHSDLEISKKYDFHELSYFYLSNVLLDNFQINNVEKEFLKKERPLRNGSRYYLAIQEKDESIATEAYGIYGNMGLLLNDTAYIAVYGNTRIKSNLGWQDYKNKIIYAFNKHDSETIMQKMPVIFLPTLLDILHKNKPYIESTYSELDFDKEISFEEFFIWWYHFIYTEATDILIERQLIKKPEKGLFYYKLKR